VERHHFVKYDGVVGCADGQWFDLFAAGQLLITQLGRRG
jgi:hypothetical protein